MARPLSNAFIYLMGIAGSGKLTVAKAIAAETDARIVDNHSINNPVFNVVRQDGQTSLPAGVWDRVLQIRIAVLDAIATLSPADWTFVFTHDAAGVPYDLAIYQLAREAAARRQATFLPVRLVCDPDEIARRVVNPDRNRVLKSSNAERARARAAAGAIYDPGTADVLTLNNTALSPTAAAQAIIAAAQRLSVERDRQQDTT